MDSGICLFVKKIFYIEYWSNVEKNERYTIQMIQEVLKSIWIFR